MLEREEIEKIWEGPGEKPEEEAAEEAAAMAETSPAEAPELNSATLPTAEEKEAAGIVDSAPACDACEGAEEEGAEAEIPGDEPIPAEVEEGSVDPVTGIAEAAATKTFTQSQVDEIAGKARKEGRDRALRDTFARYGVNSVDELDDLFGDAQRFITSQDELAERTKAWEEADSARNAELSEVKERVALLESGIDKGRYEDARLILRGKGLDVTAENIAKELETHPEWKPRNPVEDEDPAMAHFRKSPMPPAAPVAPEGPATRIVTPKMQTLGNEGAPSPDPEITERERAMRLFKV